MTCGASRQSPPLTKLSAKSHGLSITRRSVPMSARASSGLLMSFVIR